MELIQRPPYLEIRVEFLQISLFDFFYFSTATERETANKFGYFDRPEFLYLLPKYGCSWETVGAGKAKRLELEKQNGWSWKSKTVGAGKAKRLALEKQNG